MIDVPRWNADALDALREQAIEWFRQERLDESIEQYCALLDEKREVVEELLKLTADLRNTDAATLSDILTDRRKFDAFRYLSGPPVSEDDLRTLAEAESLAPSRLRNDAATASRVAEIIVTCLDKRRFPWLEEHRPPNDRERDAAALASACLMACQGVLTWRRNQSKKAQEQRVAAVLGDLGFHETSPRKIETLGDAPEPGEFCGESTVGTRKADFVIGLWDRRKMLVECKVSNSELNSVKRLNNDAAVKAEVWTSDFGRNNVVPAAVLSGVYKLASLLEAQTRGLSLFWAHDLQQFTDWITRTRSQ